MAKHRFGENKPRAKAKSRSMRGTSKAERGGEAFESALRNIEPQHQALFRRHWMKFQGSRRRTGKEPHEAFSDWLHEHPEALHELEESRIPDDEQLARAERNARKRAGLPTDAPRETPAKKASAARQLAKWQLTEHRQELRENNQICPADKRLAKTKPFRPNEDFCSDEFAVLNTTAVRSACRAKRKLAVLGQQLEAVEAQSTQNKRAFDCRQNEVDRRLNSLRFQMRVWENVLAADRQVQKPSKKTKTSGDTPF